MPRSRSDNQRYSDLIEAANSSGRKLRELGVGEASVCVILGSGLGDVSSVLRDSLTVPYHDIPHFPVPCTGGHRGELHYGRIGEYNMIILEGRVHYYEGTGSADLAIPILLARSLGVECVLFTCSAGAVSPWLNSGDLLLVRDHVDLMTRSPLREIGVRGVGRFVDMFSPYDVSIGTAIRRAACEVGINMKDGCLAAFPGPSYETSAEIESLRGSGVDAVTMSTVPEVIIARYIGLRVACIAVITNTCSPRREAPLRHVDVLGAAADRSEVLVQILARVFREPRFCH